MKGLHCNHPIMKHQCIYESALFSSRYSHPSLHSPIPFYSTVTSSSSCFPRFLASPSPPPLPPSVAIDDKKEAKPPKEKKEKKEKPAPKEKPAKEGAAGDAGGTKLGMSAKKADNFGDWYSQVCTESELISYYDVSGCYILRPWAYAMWEQVRRGRERKRKEGNMREEEEHTRLSLLLSCHSSAFLCTAGTALYKPISWFLHCS